MAAGAIPLRRGTLDSMRVARLSAAVVMAIVLAATCTPSAAPPAASPEASGPARLGLEDRDRFAAAVKQYRVGDWKGAAAGLAALGPAAGEIAEYALYVQADSLARLGEAE